MTDLCQCLRAYAPGDEDVTNGSVENYDLNWGEPVATPDCRCGECCGCGSRCSCNCRNSCGCQNCCSCEDSCTCTPEPEPDPDPVECTGGRCGCTASEEGAYPIIDL
ncbi:hypothetical protein [Candidatus Allofournierella excrementigallinarum]|uniref:hypothetical protein n=1 Tax=Candidatus Allofournierella excrementigallinarum TaxID=2838592 RepID=UPI00374EA7E5